MEPELKAYLDIITGRLDIITGRLDDLTGRLDIIPGRLDAISGRLDALTGRLDIFSGRLDDFTGRLDILSGQVDNLKDDMSAMEIRLREHTEAVETKLLTEFWKWAKTAEMRYKQDHAAVAGIDSRLEAIEDRVSELERRRAN